MAMELLSTSLGAPIILHHLVSSEHKLRGTSSRPLVLQPCPFSSCTFRHNPSKCLLLSAVRLCNIHRQICFDRAQHTCATESSMPCASTSKSSFSSLSPSMSEAIRQERMPNGWVLLCWSSSLNVHQGTASSLIEQQQALSSGLS